MLSNLLARMGIVAGLIVLEAIVKLKGVHLALIRGKWVVGYVSRIGLQITATVLVVFSTTFDLSFNLVHLN